MNPYLAAELKQLLHETLAFMDDLIDNLYDENADADNRTYRELRDIGNDLKRRRLAILKRDLAEASS